MPLVVAAVIGVLGILIVRQAVQGGDDGKKKGSPLKPRKDCVAFTLAASSEKAALLQEVAQDYRRENRKVDGQCVDAVVYAKSSGGAMDALARGWNEQVDGMRPDVWSPASSSWAVLLRHRTTAQDKPDLVPGEVKDLPSVAQTPLVIAMPRPMAQVLGWPGKPIGWGDLLALSRDPAGWGGRQHPEWGKFRLGKTNPNFSTSGLNATIGAYFAATGLSSDLTPANISDPRTVAYVKGVESSVVHYGDTTLTFLANMQAADDAGQGLSYISAATVEEKSVWDYNKGNPSGDPKTLGKHKPPRVPIVAVYPKEGTLYSDNPYVVLNGIDELKRKGANDFLKFLQSEKQQRRFQAAAFRDFSGKPGGEITEANGLLPNVAIQRLTPPAPGVLDLVQKSWASLRKRARVLQLIDVSGSMGELVKGGETKLELAKAAAIRALDQFSPDDEVGLWIFSTNRDGSKPYLQLLPIRPIRAGKQELRARIAGLTPNGGTGLYASTRAAVNFMQSSFQPDKINAVLLLTDGKNEFPADNNLDSLVAGLRGESEDTTVRVFTIGYGDDADLDVMRKIAAASRAAAYDASDPATIDKVFTNVVSNF